MTLSRRLDLLERRVKERETLRQCERLPEEFDVPLQEVWSENKRIEKELERYDRMGMTLEQALRCYAQGAGMDADEMLEEYKRIASQLYRSWTRSMLFRIMQVQNSDAAQSSFEGPPLSETVFVSAFLRFRGGFSVALAGLHDSETRRDLVHDPHCVTAF